MPTEELYDANTTDVFQKIGPGLDGLLSPEFLKSEIGHKFGMSFSSGRWSIDAAMIIDKDGKYTSSDIVIDLTDLTWFESGNINSFTVYYTLTDAIRGLLAAHESLLLQLADSDE